MWSCAGLTATAPGRSPGPSQSPSIETSFAAARPPGSPRYEIATGRCPWPCPRGIESEIIEGQRATATSGAARGQTRDADESEPRSLHLNLLAMNVRGRSRKSGLLVERRYQPPHLAQRVRPAQHAVARTSPSPRSRSSPRPHRHPARLHNTSQQQNWPARSPTRRGPRFAGQAERLEGMPQTALPLPAPPRRRSARHPFRAGKSSPRHPRTGPRDVARVEEVVGDESGDVSVR